MHRNTAYILSILVLLFWFNNRHQIKLKSFNLLPFMILLQVLMGVITLLFSTSTIPVFWGVAHQLGALFLLALLLLIRLNLKTKKAIPQQV
jgi:heme A synthase